MLSYSGLILYPASFNKMESHELRIREVGGLSILVHKNKIVNPLAEKFANKYLPRFIDSSEIRSTILSEINSHYQKHSKQHYSLKQIIAVTDDSEIPGVKESKLNVCKLCFNHASKSHMNQHLRKEHGIRRNFQQHVFRTTGYAIPNQKYGFSYLYREKDDTKPPTSMTTMEGAHTHLRHEDKFLRTINANLYYGKGYRQYLHSENKEESIPVFEAVKKYILQVRPHLKGTHPIYNILMKPISTATNSGEISTLTLRKKNRAIQKFKGDIFTV